MTLQFRIDKAESAYERAIAWSFPRGFQSNLWRIRGGLARTIVKNMVGANALRFARTASLPAALEWLGAMVLPRMISARRVCLQILVFGLLILGVGFMATAYRTLIRTPPPKLLTNSYGANQDSSAKEHESLETSQGRDGFGANASDAIWTPAAFPELQQSKPINRHFAVLPHAARHPINPTQSTWGEFFVGLFLSSFAGLAISSFVLL